MCLARDGVDLQLSILLAVAFLEAVALAALLFEDNDFVSFHEGVNDGSTDGGATEHRRADGDVIAIGEEVHRVEADGVASLGF